MSKEMCLAVEMAKRIAKPGDPVICTITRYKWFFWRVVERFEFTV